MGIKKDHYHYGSCRAAWGKGTNTVMPSEKNRTPNSCCNYVNICKAYCWKVEEKAHEWKRWAALGTAGREDYAEWLPYLPFSFPYILEHSFLKCQLVSTSGRGEVPKGYLNVLNNSSASCNNVFGFIFSTDNGSVILFLKRDFLFQRYILKYLWLKWYGWYLLQSN